MRHTPGPWDISDDETPWTCGDSRTAIEQGEEFGHTEILFPITAGDETIAYLPWEPLEHDTDRGKELRANARLIAKAPEMREQLAAVLLIIDTNGDDREHCGSDRATELDLDAFDAVVACMGHIRALLAEIDGGSDG